MTTDVLPTPCRLKPFPSLLHVALAHLQRHVTLSLRIQHVLEGLHQPLAAHITRSHGFHTTGSRRLRAIAPCVRRAAPCGALLAPFVI